MASCSKVCVLSFNLHDNPTCITTRRTVTTVSCVFIIMSVGGESA